MELRFYFRGELYRVNQQGQICANGLRDFSENWLFLGGSRHHWRNGVDVSFTSAWACPALLNGTLGWDRDYGTTRRWGGRYAGKVPRISSAHLA